MVDDNICVFCCLNLLSGPQCCLGFSWPLVQWYLPWFVHTAHHSSSSPSLVPLPSTSSVYVAFSTSMDAHLIFSSQAIGPLYPFPNYKIINSILMSASSYAAIALVCCLFLFPETVNHTYLGVISLVLDKVKAMLEWQDHLLAPQPGDFAPGCPKLKSLLGIRAAVSGMYQTCDYPSYHLLRLLFTTSIFSGGIESPSSKRVQHRSLER